MITVIRRARTLTMGGRPGPLRGGAARELGVLQCATVVVENGAILRIEDGDTGPHAPADALVIDADGRVLMPAFIDAHTHACWAGDRLDEEDRKRAGASYLDILASGGGIMSTVRDTRSTPRERLAADLLARLRLMLREGTATVEVKSGYGLETGEELKMLGAIGDANARWPGAAVPTALLGHAVDPDRPGFIDLTIGQTLDEVHRRFPGVPVDVYAEEGAWSFDDGVRLLERAQALGHPVRAHTDQFNELGLTSWAIANGAASVDHLEATSPGVLDQIGRSETAAVLLPCSGFHVDGRYADGRRLIDAGAHVVVATNCNPGSAPCSSIPLALALATRHNGLWPAEAIAAATINAAALLGFDDRGFIAPGARADLLILRHRDERLLTHEFGGDPVQTVICGGEVVRHDEPMA